jgi:3-hydroxyisobutyrate dehydrogenase
MTDPQPTIHPGTTPRVTVLGAGTMGAAIARRLLAAGLTLAVWDRNPEALQALAAVGATAHDDPHQAVTDAEVVLTLLPTGEIVTDLMITRAGITDMAPDAIWVQMGTIGVEATEHLDTVVRRARPDLRFVDAPVSGSRQPARTGQLLVLASGPETAQATLEPVFAAIARRTLWLGPAGTGSRMKLVLNTWLAFEIEAAAEAASLATRLDIAPTALAEAIDDNPLTSPLAAAKLAKIQHNDYDTDFSLEWALKDLELTRDTVGTQPAPIAVAIADRWKTLTAQGLGHLDVSAAAIGLDRI